LDQGLSAHARIHARRLFIAVIVEDVGDSEAEQWSTGVDSVEVVVGVRYAKMTCVLGSIVVGMAD
jgi:hypothetical protein